MAFLDPDEEMRLIEFMERDQQRRDAWRRTSQAETARRLGGIARRSPWVSSGIAYAFAAAGMDEDSYELREVENKEAQRKGKKKGLGWHSVGDAVAAVADPIDRAADSAVKGVKATTRAITTVASAPLEELQGLVRKGTATGMGAADFGTSAPRRTTRDEVGVAPQRARTVAPTRATEGLQYDENVDWLRSESTLGVAAGQALSGERVDLGSGFFPGGEAKEEQARRARETLSIAGRAATPGRLLAYTITEPGTTSYNVMSGLVDAGIAIWADPGAKGLGRVGRVTEARRVFQPETVGLIRGTRRTTLGESVSSWLDTREAGRVVDWLTETDDVATIWRRTKGKIPTEVMVELADATDAQTVQKIIRDAVLHGKVRDKPIGGIAHFGVGPMGGVGGWVKDNWRNVRLLQDVPGRTLDITDVDQILPEMDSFLRSARMDDDFIDQTLNAYARSSSNVERFRITTDALEGITTKLTGDVGRTAAKRLTRMYQDYQTDLARYFVDEIGNDVPVLGARIDDVGFALPTPHLFAEMINTAVPLPDSRELAAVTSRFAPILTHPAFVTSKAIPTFLMQELWKPLTLLRGAWTVRVVGEEQIRMAATGSNSAFSHPLSWIGYVAGRKGSTGVLGNELSEADEFLGAMSRREGLGLRDRRVLNKWRIVRKDEDDFAEAWGTELAQLHHDPVGRAVAGGLGPDAPIPVRTGNPLQDAKEWFWNGSGRKFREEMGQADGRGSLLTDRAAADEYVDSVHKRLQIKTNNNPELVEAVRTGKIGDAPLSASREGRTPRITPEARAALDAMKDTAPARVKGQIAIRGGQGARDISLGWYDRAVDSLFGALMGTPTDKLSRSVTFKQKYWQRAEELSGELDAAGRQALLDAAEKAGVKIKLAPQGQGTLRLEDVDTLSKGFALDETRNLLYDLSKHNKFFDATRLVFPFGEAWKEILTTWARIGTQKPQAIRRIHQGVEGARGAGFFYQDPTTGEEMFAYPGTEFVNDKLLGVPVPLEGRVQGLNLFSGSVIPGFGPVVQWPASQFIPDTPDWDWMRKVVIPYGEVDAEGGIVESFLPAWVNRFRTMDGSSDPDLQRMWNSTIGDVARYLMSTGEYSTNSEQEISRLLDDATEKAKWLYFIRGAAAFGAPSAPSWEFKVRDDDGRLAVASVLAKRYREIEQKVGPEDALVQFIEEHGVENLLLVQPKSMLLTAGLPPTKEAGDWARKNKWARENHPDVYGFFAPRTSDEFDIVAYSRQYDTGERETLTTEQQIRLANNRVASAVYDQLKKSVGESPSKKQREWLRGQKQKLKEVFPGFDTNVVGVSQKADREQKIAAIQEALKDKRLARTETGRLAAAYLAAREQAYASAKKRGLVTLQGEKAEPLREWLASGGSKLAQRDPGFADMWEQVFESEVTDG